MSPELSNTYLTPWEARPRLDKYYVPRTNSDELEHAKTTERTQRHWGHTTYIIQALSDRGSLSEFCPPQFDTRSPAGRR